MYHTLAEKFINGDVSVEDIFSLLGNPFSPLPDKHLSKIKSTYFGKIYTSEIERTKDFLFYDGLSVNKSEMISFSMKKISIHVPKGKHTAKNLSPALHYAISYTIEEIIDDMDRRPKTTKDKLTRDQIFSLIVIYWLHKAVIAYSLGMWSIYETKNTIQFTPSDDYEKSLSRIMYSFSIEKNSEISFFYSYQRYISNITKKEFGKNGKYTHFPSYILDHAVTQILDRFFFLNSRFISETDTKTLLMPQSRDIIRWLSAVLIGHIFNIPLPNNENLFRYLGLKRSVLDKMILHTNKNRNQDKGIIVDNSGIHTGSSSFPHACAQYHTLIVKQRSGNDGSTGAGDWLESKYIPNLFKESEISQRYVFMKGNKSKNRERSYDYDALLFDKQDNILYFVQIKYRFRKNIYYWTDNLTEFFGRLNVAKKQFEPSAIWAGIEQLRGTREAFGDKTFEAQVQVRLREKNLPKITPSTQNSRFIVLHTTTAFDFMLIDGIALYELNTFRNIVRGGSLGYKEDPESGNRETIKIKKKIDLDNPDHIIRTFCEELDEYEKNSPQTPGTGTDHLILYKKIRYKIPLRIPIFSLFGRRLFKNINIIVPSS